MKTEDDRFYTAFLRVKNKDDEFDLPGFVVKSKDNESHTPADRVIIDSQIRKDILLISKNVNTTKRMIMRTQSTSYIWKERIIGFVFGVVASICANAICNLDFFCFVNKLLRDSMYK